MRKPWERGVYSVGVYPTLPHRTNLRSDKNPASSTGGGGGGILQCAVGLW